MYYHAEFYKDPTSDETYIKHILTLIAKVNGCNIIRQETKCVLSGIHYSSKGVGFYLQLPPSLRASFNINIIFTLR